MNSYPIQSLLLYRTQSDLFSQHLENIQLLLKNKKIENIQVVKPFSLFFLALHLLPQNGPRLLRAERDRERSREVRMACIHDHSCEEHNCSSDWSLYKHIDLSKVQFSYLSHYFSPIHTINASSVSVYGCLDRTVSILLYLRCTQAHCSSALIKCQSGMFVFLDQLFCKKKKKIQAIFFSVHRNTIFTRNLKRNPNQLVPSGVG